MTTRGSTREHFENLFVAHYSRIVAVLQRMLGDRGHAEELASEAFLKLYRQPLAERPDGNVPGWLYRTATNLGIDALRAAARRNRTVARRPPSGDGASVTLAPWRSATLRTIARPRPVPASPPGAWR